MMLPLRILRLCLLIALPELAGTWAIGQAGPRQTRPDAARFEKKTVLRDLQTPLRLQHYGGELYILESTPTGNIRVFNPKTGQSRSIACNLPTFQPTEYGLVGMVLDPNFGQNHWVYLHYFPKATKQARLSRFTVQGDSVARATEKIYLEFPHFDDCCHSAGGMDFDSKGNLYVSTGDNTNAFETSYAPINDSPGREQYDAFRSAGNTNDYRGKILRIHPEADGTYTIPDGNLFPAGMPATKPEIYTMGNRNPFQLHVDRTNDILYWGENGPDSGIDSTYGPRGYDEFNIATRAGNYGWPAVIGNNQPYANVRYAEGRRIDGRFDPQRPVNPSRNNTGRRDLPSAQPAVIWYPYDESTEFAGFGRGGRTAIGGPVYHYDARLESAVKLPEYYDGHWFMADWMRNWIRAARLTDGGRKVAGTDPILPDAQFLKPIDLEFGPEGALYVLEYGSNWGNNTDATLSRIEYNRGNRPPVARLTADRTDGKLPLTVRLSAGGSDDPDRDAPTYRWQTAGGPVFAKSKTASYTFRQAGRYVVTLTVRDPAGATSVEQLTVVAGNTRPRVSIRVPNRTFYFDNVPYQVDVTDAEDKPLARQYLTTTLAYLPRGSRLDGAAGAVFQPGEVLLNESDCRACHQLNAKSVGPAFRQIAARYVAADSIVQRLSHKVITGGAGVWGEAVMSAHPQLSDYQAAEMVKYILSLKADAEPVVMEPSGRFITARKEAPGREGVYVLTAQYRDQPVGRAGSLSAESRTLLRYPVLHGTEAELFQDMDNSMQGASGKIIGWFTGSWCGFRQIDMTNIGAVRLRAQGDAVVELRADAPDGPLLGQVKTVGKDLADYPISLPPTTGAHNLYFVFRRPSTSDYTTAHGIAQFTFLPR